MAQRKRDYKREYQRRVELAKIRNFDNYYQQRRAIETGKTAPIAPWRVRTRRTLDAYADYLFNLEPTRAYDVLAASISREQQCRDWSAGYAKTALVKYKPSEAKKLGLTKAEYTDLYYYAFVGGPEAYRHVRRNKGGSDYLYRWFVELHHIYEASEYDERYATVN